MKHVNSKQKITQSFHKYILPLYINTPGQYNHTSYPVFPNYFSIPISIRFQCWIRSNQTQFKKSACITTRFHRCIQLDFTLYPTKNGVAESACISTRFQPLDSTRFHHWIKPDSNVGSTQKRFAKSAHISTRFQHWNLELCQLGSLVVINENYLPYFKIQILLNNIIFYIFY